MKRYRIEKGEYSEQPSMEMVSKPIIRNIMHFFKGDFIKSSSFNVKINKDNEIRGGIMGKRKRRGKLSWRSRRANKGRKPCRG